MKRRRPVISRVRIFFVLLVLLGILLTAVLAAAGAMILGRLLGRSVAVPPYVWGLLLAVVLGFGLSLLYGRLFVAPLVDLNRAMGEVAQGNYSVRLREKSWLPEIRDAYKDFNTMVQGLAATEILQTDFVSNVSHEFKTPITAIEGYATLLQDEGVSRELQQAYVQKILLGTSRLSELVGSILQLSRLENRTAPSDPSVFRLDEQIRQAIVLLEPAWSAKDTEFDVEMEELEIKADEGLLFQVWRNLIDNAVKFGPAGGRITLRLEKEAGQIRCTLEDEGPGIEENALQHIFEKFYRSPAARSEEGNGLGLALVKRILDIHGGSVQAENRPEGGCRFTVLLPD